MNEQKNKVQFWTEIAVTMLSVGLTAWIMLGRPKVAIYASFYGAKVLRSVAASVGSVAITAEQSYYRMVTP